MSYCTTLYAVDLDRLRAAVGSMDEKLVARVHRVCFSEDHTGPVGNVIHVEVDAAGTLLLEGRTADIPTVQRAVEGLTGPGDNIRYHAANREAATPVWAAVVQTVNGMIARLVGEMNATGRTLDEMTAAGRAVPSINVCGRDNVWEAEPPSRNAPAADEEAAVRRVVFGEVGGGDDASEPAYALRHLCRVLGKELDTGDALGGLDDLGLDSPLCHPRMPVALPTPADFPVVSYLTPEEVAAEVSRLETMDLKYPADEDIERARKVLLRCLKAARKKRVAVVAFYY